MLLLRIFKKISRLLSGHQKLRILELAFLMVVGGLLEMASVSLVLPFMNAVMDSDATMEKWYVLWICDLLNIDSAPLFLMCVSIILAVSYLIKNIYLLFEYNIQYRFTYGNMLQMQKKLLQRFLNKPYEYYLQVTSGEIIRLINNDVADVFYMVLVLLEILTEAVVSAMLMIGLFVMAPIITTVIAVVLLTVMLIILVLVKPVLYKAGSDYQEASAGMNKWILQAISGIKEIRIANKEEFFQNKFGKYGDRYVRAIRKNRILEMVPKFIIEASCMSSMFVLVAVLIYHGVNLQEIIPVLTAVAMAAIRLLPSINRISQSIAALAYRETRLDRLLDYIEKKDSYTDNHLTNETTLSFTETIKLENVIYHYPNSKVKILDSVNLTINHGESIGFVGASGSGKTTTVDIILGLLAPIKGRVLVDDIDIIDKKRVWTAQIGYIPQAIFMLDGTIRENIAFGVESSELDDCRIWKSLEEASLDGYVKGLPDGLDTEIGERGIRLSGGQRQRIGIARALYHEPDVLVFDEATSALDHETEKEVIQSINKLIGKRTIIIIAHRLTTIKNCDHVFRVQDGLIIKER